MSRRLFTLLAFVTVLACSPFSRAADVEFLRIWLGWRDAPSFDRISEYFGRGENTGRELVLRSQPGERAGYYFLVRLKSAAAIPGAKFELSVIRPDAPEPKTFSFPIAVPKKETVFELGLTGTDWSTGAKSNPVAWKLVLLGTDGQMLAERKSFLWELPAK